MGVQGLERYLLDEHPKTCPRVSIAELASKYKETTGRDSAVAVVDGGILLYHVMGPMELRYGGQFKEFGEAMVAFARRLQDVGVQPVFYFKGSVNEGRLNVWQDRKMQEVGRVASAYWSLDGVPKSDFKRTSGSEQAAPDKCQGGGRATSCKTGKSGDEAIMIDDKAVRTGDEAAANTSDEAAAKTGDEAAAKTGDEATTRTVDEAAAKTGDEAAAKTGDEATAKTGDEAAAKTGDEATAKTGDEAAAKTSDEAAAKTSDEAAAKTGDEATAKTGDEATAKTGDEAAAKTSDEAATRTGGEAAVNTGDDAGAGPVKGAVTTQVATSPPEPEVEVVHEMSTKVDQMRLSNFYQRRPEENAAADGDSSSSRGSSGSWRGPRGSHRGDHRGRGGGWDSSRSERGRVPQRLCGGARGPRGGGRGFPQRGRGGQLFPRRPHEGGPRPVGGLGYLLPAGTPECAKQVLKAAGYEVMVSVGALDLEIARYARTVGAFCILSRDTDFVAMEGAHHYMSIAHLDKEAMTTLCFDRDAIASALGLTHRGQLPLLLSLMPNGCVPAAWLLPLHHRMIGGRVDTLCSPTLRYRLEHLVDRLGQMVCTELWEKDPADAVQAVVTRALASYPAEVMNRYAAGLHFKDRWAMRESLRLQLESSLRAFDYTPPQGKALPAPPALEDDEAKPEPEVLLLARARHRSLQFVTSCVLPLLTHRLLEQSPVLEDPDLPPRCGSALALRPLRRRMYGVLLRPEKKNALLALLKAKLGKQAVEQADEASPPCTVVREFIVPSSVPPGCKLEPVDVEPIVPDAAAVLPDLRSLPSPCSLWRGGEAVEEAQWRLLTWCLCPSALTACSPSPSPCASQGGGSLEGPCGDVVVDGLVQRLRELPRRLALPAAALFLMMHTGALPAAVEERAKAATRRPATSGDGDATPCAATPESAEDAPAAEAAPDAGPVDDESTEAPSTTPTEGAEQSTSPQPLQPLPKPLDKELTALEWVRLVAKTCVLAGQLSAGDVGALPAPRPHRMGVHVAALFTRSWSYLSILNDILGAPVPAQEMQPANCFDGKVFQCLVADAPVPHEVDNVLMESLVLAAFTVVSCSHDAADGCR